MKMRGQGIENPAQRRNDGNANPKRRDRQDRSGVRQHRSHDGHVKRGENPQDREPKHGAHNRAFGQWQQ